MGINHCVNFKTVFNTKTSIIVLVTSNSIFILSCTFDAMIAEGGFNTLPVVDEQGYLKGLLSTRDLLTAFVNVMGINEPGSLLCILAHDIPGQMKKIVDIVAEENISLGSVLTTKSWDGEKRAIFPYLFTNNVVNVKKKLLDIGFELIDPMSWYLDQLPKKVD